MRFFLRAFGLVSVVSWALSAASCGGGDCVEDQPQGCAPLYEPTFDNVFEKTLSTTCSAGSSCHSSSSAQGGLTLDDIDAAYQGLTGGLVTPGDASCGELVARLSGADPATLMPPGQKLSDAERCALETWIRNGAKR